MYTYCNDNTHSNIQTYSTTAQYSTEQYDRTQHNTICLKYHEVANVRFRCTYLT
jgi:hypothetical protein